MHAQLASLKADQAPKPAGLQMLETQQKNERWASGISTYTINSYPLVRMKPLYRVVGNSPGSVTLKRVARSCAVCLEQIRPGESARALKCRHIFHRQCIDDWLKLRGKCPLDRLSML